MRQRIWYGNSNQIAPTKQIAARYPTLYADQFRLDRVGTSPEETLEMA